MTVESRAPNESDSVDSKVTTPKESERKSSSLEMGRRKRSTREGEEGTNEGKEGRERVDKPRLKKDARCESSRKRNPTHRTA